MGPIVGSATSTATVPSEQDNLEIASVDGTADKPLGQQDSVAYRPTTTYLSMR
jgi:hypothetical protein